MVTKSNFINPATVIKSVGLGAGDTVIDYASGSGYWALTAARQVGAEGEVFALDENPELLQRLEKQAISSGLTNLKTVLLKPGTTDIPVDRKANLILFSSAFSSKKAEKGMIHSCRNHAFVGTKLVIIEWNDQGHHSSDKYQIVTEEELMILAKKAGFVFKKLLETGKHHYGLYFEYGDENE